MKMRPSFEQLAREPQGFEIDKTKGRCQILGGHVFYSPNSARDVLLPPSPNQPSVVRAVQRYYPPTDAAPNTDAVYATPDLPIPITRNPAVDDVSEFHQPLWWTREYCYLSFIPVESITSSLLQHIFSTPQHFGRGRQGFCMDPRVVLDWNRLEHDLRHVVDVLFQRAGIKGVPEVFRTAVVCTGTYSNIAPFRQAVSRSREWFQYWIGRLSYAIAASMTCDGDSIRGLPADAVPSTYVVSGWYEDLARSSWHQLYLSSVQSAAANFDPSIVRAGVFLDPFGRIPQQFSVDWFCRFNIPVWYPWGPPESTAALSDPAVAHFGPLPHQLQAVAATSVPRFIELDPCASLPYKTLDDIREYTSWQEFFSEREARNRGLLQEMSPDALQSYKNRTFQPASKSCRVYVWVKKENSYCRVGVAKVSFQDVWEDFSTKQRVYDALENAWDCCEEFYENSTEELWQSDDDSDIYAITKPNADEPYAMHQDEETQSPSPPHHLATKSYASMTPSSYAVAPCPSCPSSNSSVASPDGLLHGLSSLISAVPRKSYTILDPIGERFEAVHILHEYFGFVPPLPLIPKPGAPLPARPDRIRFHAVLGMGGRPNDAFFDSAYGNYAIDFLKCLDISHEKLELGDPVPSSELWDLASDNRMCIRLNSRLRLLRKASESLFVFEFGGNSTTSWTLGVFNAAVALLVCRLPENLNDYGLAFSLLQRGIPFATLARSPFQSMRHPPTQILPVRLPCAAFSSTDYDVYVQERNTLLANPRVARAALLKGGIIWRIVGQACQFATALLGHTVAASSGRIAAVYPDGSNQPFFDDIISEKEMDILCGTIICMTGHATVCELRSWWPRHSTWAAAVSHPHWSQTYENLFIRRSQALEEGSAKPLTTKEWKQLIRLSSTTRRVSSSVTFHSEDFIARL